MGSMFESCIKLSSLDISTFNTSGCKNFTNMFENDEGLNLYIDSKISSNLMQQIPGFVKVNDISKN